MDRLTTSEVLFERYCSERSYPCKRIEESEVRTPDYQVEVGGVSILAEIKQIDMNQEDRMRHDILENGGTHPAFYSEDGSRLRNKIRTASKQLKARVALGQPAIIIIYNNAGRGGGWADPRSLKAAMFGREIFEFTHFKNGRFECTDQHLGSGQSFTQQHNTTVSAVCVLEEKEQHLNLIIYHNHYAKVSLSQNLFTDFRDLQFKLAEPEQGTMPDWVAV